jgi:hypothetical protein
MNNNIIKILFVAIATTCTISTYAQFNIGGTPGDRWGRTNDPNPNNTIRRIGIGNFLGTDAPASAFHINANYLTPLNPLAPNTFLPGEVFRTTGPSANVNAWRMFTGAGNGTERFHITVPANSDNANIFTTQNGFLAFGTNNTERLRITAAGEIQIKALACNGCIVTTNQQGQLIADNQLVNKMEERIKMLEEKIAALENLSAEK